MENVLKVKQLLETADSLLEFYQAATFCYPITTCIVIKITISQAQVYQFYMLDMICSHFLHYPYKP